MPNNTLVLGAGGMIGTILRFNLRARSKDTIFFQSRYDSRDIDLVWQMGMNNFSVLERFIFENEIKKIVMLYGGQSFLNTGNDIMMNLIEDCYEIFYQTNIKKVLVASSSAVYADRGANIYSENHPTSDHSPYQNEKSHLETLSKKFFNKFEDLLLMRLTNVLGADSLTRLYVYSKNHDFILNKYNNGFLKRSYLSPSSLAYVIGELLYTDSKLPFVMNISTYKELSMDQILHGLGISFLENKINNDGHNVILENSLLESFIDLPLRYRDVDFALEDLIAFKLLVEGEAGE